MMGSKNCLDNRGDRVSHAGMRCNWVSFAARIDRQLSKDRDARNSRRDGTGLRGVRLLAGAMVLCLCASGCTKPIAEHATAVAAATAPVVDQATAAYAAAIAIHDQAENFDAVTEFEKISPPPPAPPAPVYNPRTVEPLLSQEQVELRLAVLKGLQAYTKSVVAVSDPDSKDLDDAAKSLGGSLAGLGNSFLPAGMTAPSKETIVVTGGNTTNETISTQTPAISAGEQKGMSVAIDALGQYLVSRKVKSELPGIVEKMDPEIKDLCELLAKEIDILSSQETIDFNLVIDRQTLFLRTASGLDPEVRREQIMKLPELARQQKQAAQQLKVLRAALVKLEMTHHALAAELQGNNPESIKQKISDLGAAGGNLGKFYSSLAQPAGK